MFEIAPEDFAAAARTAAKVAKAVNAAGRSRDGINLMQANGEGAGQSVGHFHLHIIPRRKDDGLLFNWEPKPGDRASIAEMAERIRGCCRRQLRSRPARRRRSTSCTASPPRQASRRRWPATWIARPRVSARNWPSGVSATRKAIARSRAVSERIGQGAAQMAGADRLGMRDAHAGKGEARLGVGGAERRQRGDVVDQPALAPRPTDSAPSIAQLRHQPLAVEAVAEPLGEKVAQRVELVRGDREARRHRMAAAIDQQPGLARRDHRRAERQPGTERPEPLPMPSASATTQAGRS